MIAKKGRMTSLSLLLAAAVMALPGAATANHVPEVVSLDVFGDATPEVDQAQSEILHAYGAPWGRGVTLYGHAWVRGKAGAGSVEGAPVYADIAVNDDLPDTPPVTKSVIVNNKFLPDGSPNPTSGEFLTYVNVTDLGTHTATGDKDLGDGGFSALTFSVRARKDNASGAPVTDTLTKVAGARYDATAPVWESRPRGGHANPIAPSGIYCHYPPSGFPNRLDRVSGEYFAADNNGCTEAKARRHLDFLGGPTDEQPAGPEGFSEISDVTITITGGTLTSPRIYKPALTRYGGGANFGMTLYIDQFDPTQLNGPRPGGQNIAGLGNDTNPAPPYSYDITVTDAWGNALVRTGTFDICSC